MAMWIGRGSQAELRRRGILRCVHLEVLGVRILSNETHNSQLNYELFSVTDSN
jgi:hypothetical protein